VTEMSAKLPAIMLEALYGDDFEHGALDKLVRIARSYLELAVDEGASVSQRARDMAAAVEILEVAGEEILRCRDAPMAESWGYGHLEGRRASAMVLRTLERPGEIPELMVFDISLHVGDPSDPSTEPTKSTYRRQQVELRFDGDRVENVNKAVFGDLPLGRYTHVGLWSTSSGRLVFGFELSSPVITRGGDAVSVEDGALRLAVK
jgi:hypothetical protein